MKTGFTVTLDAVQARAYEIADAGDEPGQRMRFSVLYGDVLVEIGVKGNCAGGCVRDAAGD